MLCTLRLFTGVQMCNNYCTNRSELLSWILLYSRFFCFILFVQEALLRQPNGTAEVQCELFGPISGSNFGR